MKESMLDGFADLAKDSLYRMVYRGPDDELPSAVYDTIEILYKNAPMKPFIFRKRLIGEPKQLQQYKTLLLDGNDDLPKKKVKTEKQKLILPKHFSAEEILRFIKHRPKKKQTWFLIVHLPPGCSYSEFKSKEHFFSSAVGGSAEIERVGQAVYPTHMSIQGENFFLT